MESETNPHLHAGKTPASKRPYGKRLDALRAKHAETPEPNKAGTAAARPEATTAAKPTGTRSGSAEPASDKSTTTRGA